MKKPFLIISLFILLFPLRSQAQHNIRLSIGGGAFISNIDHWKLPYWDNGYDIQVGAGYEINNQVSLNLSTSYQRMLFDKSKVNYPYFLPMYIDGNRYQMVGNNSSLLDFSTSAKLFVTKGMVSPYLSGGVGLLYIKQGKIVDKHWYGSNLIQSTILDNTGRHYILGETNVSIGMKIGFSQKMGLDLNLKLIRAFYGPIYMPVTTSIFFKL